MTTGMPTLDEGINLILGLLLAGCIFRAVYCLVRSILSASDEAEVESYRKRAINTVIFLIIASCVWTVVSVVRHYYGWGTAFSV
jgi:nitrate reductase NapE component